MEIAPDVHQVRMLGADSFLITEERLTLIDAGMIGSRLMLERYLRRIGRRCPQLADEGPAGQTGTTARNAEVSAAIVKSRLPSGLSPIYRLWAGRTVTSARAHVSWDPIYRRDPA